MFILSIALASWERRVLFPHELERFCMISFDIDFHCVPPRWLCFNFLLLLLVHLILDDRFAEQEAQAAQKAVICWEYQSAIVVCDSFECILAHLHVLEHVYVISYPDHVFYFLYFGNHAGEH